MHRLTPLFLVLSLLVLRPASAAEAGDFASWLHGMRQDAQAQGITSATLDRAFAGVKPIPRVIELDHSQPETTLTFAEYQERVASPERRQAAHEQYLLNKSLLDEIGQRYGVQPRYIVALWGIETNFGQRIGSYPVIAALATLAYDGRRAAFFRRELINALRIVQTDNIDPAKMIGSWAGAMGQSQFMPSSFLAYAVSYRDAGAPDIWTRKDDVFASIANYLSRVGWRGDQPWGEPAVAPANLDSSQIGPGKKKSVAEWAALGVKRADGRALPSAGPEASWRAALLQPAGSDGPSFLVYDNFNVIMRWNNSSYFAVAVGSIADSVD
ncbi:MAG TPA: lytic murein transglycosylase [Stellaceae bacterium]|nr:lytic murein transglycosylase [Stellaceae bacterium]